MKKVLMFMLSALAVFSFEKVLMFMLSALAVFSFAGCADDSSNADGGGL